MGRLYQRDGSDYWWADYRDESGRRRRRSTRCKAKAAARQKLATWERRAEMRSAGVDAPDQVDQEGIARLIEEYHRHLASRDLSEQYVEDQKRSLEIVLEPARALDQVTTQWISGRLRELREERDWSARTQNKYRKILHAWYEWLGRTRRWHSNPASHVDRVKEHPERRRALDRDQVLDLIESVPEYRSVCYRLAVTTGLRKGELRDLTWGDLDLEDGSVLVRSSVAKNAEETTLPLPAGTVRALRDWHEGQGPDDPVFDRVPTHETFYRDLKRIGVRRKTAQGRVDFHSLRVTFVTSLARAGVSLQQAQRLARHSTPQMTANIYTRLELHDAREAVSRIDLDDDQIDPPALEAV